MSITASLRIVLNVKTNNTLNGNIANKILADFMLSD